MKIQKRKSTKIDLKALKFWHSKVKSDHWIAKKLGVSQTGISRARQKLTLEPNFLCHINDNEKAADEIYEDFIQRGRTYKKENKATLRKKTKQYNSTKEYREKHRNRERENRAKLRDSRNKQLMKKGFFVEVKPYQKTVTINGKRKIIDVEGHLRNNRGDIKGQDMSQKSRV